MRRLLNGWLVVWALAIIAAFFALPVAAQSNQTIAQAYQIEGDSNTFIAGALVYIKQDDTQTVGLATKDTANQLLGVVDTNPLLAISAVGAKVQVVVGGNANALVSDINGAIKSGDSIAPSPIPGVGMLATSNTKILGTAQSDFDITKGETKAIPDNSGTPHDIHIGYVPVQIGVTYYQPVGSSFLPPFIQDVANSIAGRPVALVRVLLGTIIALFGMASIAIFIYSSVRSAMVSLGRNPLAARNIRKSIYQVAGMAAAFLVATLLISYLIIAL